MTQRITDYEKYRLGMSWGIPFADGYGKTPTNNQELMDMMSGKTRGRYRDRGYTYLDFDKSKSEAGRVVYSLVDKGHSGDKDSEWQNMEHRKGEFEVVGLETENMGTTTVRFDKGSQQSTSDSVTRATVAKNGQMTVGIWKLEWQRDEGGQLQSLVATTNSKEFKRKPETT